MPRIDRETHQSRKDRLWLTLQRHPNGLTETELAQTVDGNRRTINNWLRDLETAGKVYKEDHSPLWFALPYDRVQLRKFDLSPEEGMALYLATRLFTKQHDKRNEPAETALLKLADVLTADAGVGREIHQAALELAHRPTNDDYHKVFRTIMQGYIYRRTVQITYESARGAVFTTDFDPYLLEPSAIGFTTYAIGHSQHVNALRTYKLERIRSASLTRREYVIPRGFPGLDILRTAWSIIYGEETQTVVLRFSPNVRARVLETRWHPSEVIADDPERPGHLRWTAQLADTTDFLPWVRGWGADCEVLEPKELRERLTQETRRMAALYVIEPHDAPGTPPDRVLRCWGKTVSGSDDPNAFHPALFHMLDVGNVARALLGDDVSIRWRRALGQALGIDADGLKDWLPYWVALHDIGKISSAFQQKNKAQKERLSKEGFAFGGGEATHAELSQIYLADMGNAGGGGNGLTRIMSEAMGGHHGRFAHPEDIKKARARLSGEPSEWGALRQKADALLRERLASGAEVTANTATNLSTAVMAMTGFTILCDWLGSDGAYFEPANETDLDEYAILSQEFAERAVRESGLGAGTLSGAPLDVGELFADLGGLRPLQTAINDVPDTLLQTATLTIIEAPTGEGKTEAALALAHRMARAGGTDEMYYALPTMATSNQMFGRLAKHMEVRLGLGAAIKLVHGQAHLIEEDLRAATEMNAPLGNGDDARQDAADDAVTWFNSKKRALIAPFGVGTVDQAELAALNVKHATLRMMGLVGKVVIIDEVHAYDTYMTTIIERLLRWLAAMHTSVILLSATLPAARRRKLAEAFGAEMELPETALTAYPNLLVLGRDGYHHASPAAWQAGRTLTLGDLHLGDDDAAQKAAWLASAVADGGCACWITNTVRRAQNIFRNLQKIAPVGTQLQLLHSQFPLDARLAREQALEKAYGRPGEEVERPVRGIVVGTQVLEQSLDLDFDVMVSDLAPVDLLLQRAGRLHRHERQRPAAHATPRLWVNWERNADGGLRMGSDRTIYDEYIMRVTHRTLGGRTVIRLPADYRTLIEAVYADREPAADDPLRDAWDNLKRKEQYAQQEARQRLLPEPLARDSFARMSAVSVAFEEDENRADWIVAQTRLGEETLNVIPLERDKDDAILPGGMRVPIGRAATLETQRRLLKRQLRVSQREAIGAIRADAQAAPCGLFSDSNLLKGFLPLWLTQGQARLVTERGPLVLALDVALGLIITKEASNA